MNFLSWKKFRIAFAVLLLAVAIGFLASRSSRSQYGTIGILSVNNLNAEIQAEAIKNIAGKDTDGDGLKDWEEALWGSDPHNSDTDGDGTPDSEEVALGRNPIIAGPNDKFDNTLALKKKEDDNKYPEKDLTATDLFAQNLFAEYLSLRGSRERIDDTDKNTMIDSVIKNALDTKINNQYAISDLNIIEDNSAAALKKYGNDFISTTQLYSRDLTQDETVVFERMLKEENQKDAEYLEKSASAYDSAADKLKQIKIPNNLALIHLNIINNYSIISDALKDMSLTLNDPIRGMNGFAVYLAVLETQKEFFKEIKDYFDKNRIIFNSYDAGYIWNLI